MYNVKMLYNLFFIIFSIFYLPYFLIKGKWRGFSRQRFGVFLDKELAGLKGERPIWIHAVSVGEVIATLPFYEEIRSNYPDEKLVVSTTTPTGYRIASDRFRDASAIIYFPLDISFITDKVADKINPKAVLIAETEIWPNFIESLDSHGAKIVIFNGRLSTGSFKGYRMAAFLLRRVLHKVALFIMQSQADADKIICLGADREKVKVSGNLKYDAAFAKSKTDNADAVALRKKFGLDTAAEVFICGSTHPGEEEIILRSYKDLSPKFPNLRLVIAPRHTDRSQGIADLAQSCGLKADFISRLNRPNAAIAKDEILILDVMGALSALYCIGDIIFIGGSLIRKGGQNPLEAAYHSKAILFGPYTHNFGTITEDLLNAEAAIRVKDEASLRSCIASLIEDPSKRRAMGEKARALLEANAGVAKKDLELIRSIIS